MHIELPGSKSIANRLLILSSFCQTPLTLLNPPQSTDTAELINTLNKLGAEIITHNNQISIANQHQIFTKKTPLNIKTGNGGTTNRFLNALTQLIPTKTTLIPGPQMQKRPIQHINIHQNKIHLPPQKTSQDISALLLTTPFKTSDTEITLKSPPPSTSYIEMTLKILQKFHIQITHQNYQHYFIKGNQTPKKITQITIEPDASSLSYFLLYKNLHPNKQFTITLPPKNSLQGDNIIQQIFQKPLPTKLDLNNTPDLTPTLAIYAATLPQTTTFSNIAHLKHKESNRIQTLATELQKLRLKIHATSNSLTITGPIPTNLLPTTIQTHNDHRLAMAFSILQTKHPQLKIQNPSCINKSYANFFTHLKEIHENISR